MTMIASSNLACFVFYGTRNKACKVSLEVPTALNPGLSCCDTIILLVFISILCLFYCFFGAFISTEL